MTLITALAAAGPAVASPADLCREAARMAAEQTSVPTSVLLAITQTETGRGAGDRIEPWPWTVNMEGEGHWFADPETAIDFIRAAQAGGATSFDVGCFQINHRWHGDAFASLDEMFDPTANALYAADFLTRLHAESGDWSAAAGAYHSRTQVHAERYRARFDSLRAAAVAEGADDGATPRLASVEGLPRANSFPLLQGGGSARLGSLVPLGGGG